MDYSKKPGDKIEKIGEIVNCKEKKTISIITPFYNGGKTLMETANSVFSQTYPYFEWIIVDDGSKDKESLKKLSELEKMDERIRVFHKENGGPSVARDFGISQTAKETKYIFFIDCDDIIDKTMLECLYCALETHKEASFAYTTMVNFGDREFLWEQYFSTEREKVENVVCISSMVRKTDLIEVGCFGIKEKAMYEDWNLWLKLLEKGKKPLRINAPLFWYRISNSGEFSRAQKNNKNAMKYVNETAKKITEDVEAIQFPREGNRFAKVNSYDDMILPNYKQNRKTNILFIFPWMVVGGADYFNLDLLKRLDKEKYESTILTTLPSTNDIRQEFEEYATIYDMASFLERNDYLNFTDYIIKSRNIDVVFISNTLYGYYMVPYLKRKYPHIAFIDYIHSIDSKDPRHGFGRATQDVNKYLTATYCCNNFTKHQLETNFNKKNVETVYIGTDHKKFDPRKNDKKQMKIEYNLPTDKYIISFIARLSEEKRPEMFIDIGKELLRRRNDVYFVIGGDGPLMKDVESKVNSNFRLLGRVHENEKFYAFSDITVNCSSLEGLALTSYESVSMGVPVVSTDVGGQTELIDETVGEIVHYNPNPTNEIYKKEVIEYADKIEKVIANLEELSKNCRKKIETSFSLDLMAEKITNGIQKAIKKEKKCKSFEDNSPLEYELAIEALHHDYFLYCKFYIENKFGIEYEENETKKKGNKLKRRIKSYFYRKNSIKESKKIYDALRSLYMSIRSFLYFIKFFFIAIPAVFILIYKLIINRHK